MIFSGLNSTINIAMERIHELEDGSIKITHIATQRGKKCEKTIHKNCEVVNFVMCRIETNSKGHKREKKLCLSVFQLND